MNEIQKKEVEKIEQGVQAQSVPPMSLAEKYKILGEKISEFLLSIGIESRRSKIMLFCMLIVAFFVTSLSFFLMPPLSFQKGKIVVIKNGFSLGQTSLLLKEEHLIRSRLLFEFCAMTINSDKSVHAGQYLFKTPIGACSIAIRMTKGIFGIPAIRVTIPEGMSNKETAIVLSSKLSNFDTVFFAKHAQLLEGYLFPDTYFFSTEANTQDIEAIMKVNFNKKIEPFIPSITASGHSLNDIVIMASIIEKEAMTDNDKMIVSGVLWNRIKKGMPLQVDAPFLYMLGKKSSELTQTDLQIDSAYNTYRNRGLPVAPIGNPGLSAISAAINPHKSEYLYYLSDRNGGMHYAKTFGEHKANKEKYLWGK